MTSTTGRRMSTVSLPSDVEVVITREFAAPRADVFEAWTRPEHLTHWWDPSGRPLRTCEIDLRPGGRFCFVRDAPDGAQHPFAGTYREVIPPSRLVFATALPSGAESVGTLIFEALEDSVTRLTMTMTCQSRADRDALLAARIDVGTMRTLDNLDSHLRRAHGSTRPG